MEKNKVIGMVIILATLISLGVWELWGRENLMYDRVLVLSSDMEKGQVVEKENLREKRVENANSQAIKSLDYKSLLGKETAHFIPKNTELFEEYFQEEEFNIEGKGDKMVFPIPKEWLLAYPDTIRRGDRALFYYKGKILCNCYVIHVRDGSNQEVNYSDHGRLKSDSKAVSIEVVVDFQTLEKMKDITKDGEKLILLYQ